MTMDMENPMIIQGPPLPPKVSGDLLGTLTIRLQACSTTNGAFARIQFWGSSEYSDLHLLQSSNTSNAPAVEYPLIGSIPSLDNYMKDASPLRVTFLRPSNNNNNELIGYVHISDLSITDKLKPESITTEDQDGNTTAAIRTIKLSLRREVQIVSPNNTAVSSDSVGKAVFELLFRVIVPPPRPQPQQVQMIGNRQMTRQVLQPNVQSSSKVPSNNLHPHNTNPSYFAQGQCKNSSVNNDSSIGQYSGDMYGGNSSIEEKQSLLEELLELCTDDMTIPTVNSDPSCIDPYDMWISRMVQHASSPTPKAFPSLVSAGSDQSNALRKVGLLKLEINSLSLSSSVTDKLKGKNDFYIQYNPPLYGQANNLSPLLDQQVEFVVCEQFSSGNPKVTTNNRKSLSSKVAKKLTSISLLTDIHTNEMKVVSFQDDECVRQWLDGTITFDLFCRPSSTAGHTPKLPRVAMLSAVKRKERKLGKICIAQATLKLCDLLLSDTLTTDVKLDLLLSEEEEDELLSDVGKVSSTKVGSMSLRLGLYPGNNTTSKTSSAPPSSQAQPIEASDRAAYHEKSTPIMVNRFQPSLAMSSTTPHPISVFLSNFARGTIDDNVPTNKTMPSSTGNGRQAPSQETHAPSGLKPVKAPPVWLDVRVKRLSKSLTLDTNANIKLGISCNEPILSSSEPINSQKTVDISQTKDICSWQIALDSAERKQDCATIITLHIYRVDDKSGDASSEEKTLFGLVKIPFIVTMPKQSWLPAIVNNSWLDILDPTSHTTKGKIQVLIVAGMLRQVRGFSLVCKSTLTIQKWWKKVKSASKEVAKPKVVLESLNISEIKTATDDTPLSKDEQEDVIDTIHEGFNVSQQKKRQKDDDDPTSPDSLFEEWSQQSQSLSMNMHKLPTSVVHETSIGEEDVTLDSAIDNDEAVPSVEAACLKTQTSSCNDKDESSLKPSALPVHQQSGGVPRVNIHPLMSAEQTTTTQEDPTMSTIKPMNLEVSFSCGQDEMSRRPKGIDPPEEITPKPLPPSTRVPKAPSNAKRKLDTPSSSDVDNEETTRVYKRYRLKESTVTQQFNPPLKPLHESMNEDAANENAQQDNGDESETLCPSSSEASFECDDDDDNDQDSDSEDVLTYRSLSSMIGSLDDINSKLTSRVAAEPPPERQDSSSPSDTTNSSGIGVDTLPQKHHAAPPKHHDSPPQQEPQGFERLDSPGRPKIEPPEEKSSAPKRFNDEKIVKTCEKGISTTKLLYADATTSPSDSLMDNTNSRVDDDGRHHQKSSDIATKPEIREQDENDEHTTTQAENSEKRVHTSHSAAYQPRRGQYSNHLTRGRGSSATKRYSSLLSSHLRGLSPVLNPTRRSPFRQRHLSRSPLREITQKDKRDNNSDVKENKSLSKERLEQIFKS